MGSRDSNPNPLRLITIPIAEMTTSTTLLLTVTVDLIAGMSRISPLITCRLRNWLVRSASFEGVLASTLMVLPALRVNLRAASPVPPVAPKMATVFCVEADIVRGRAGNCW